MTHYNLPDERGYFDKFGGRYMPETLTKVIQELEEAYKEFKINRKMQEKYAMLLKDYAGRPTPLYYAENLSRKTGIHIYLKREDLLHTGAHKLNNTLGQILLAQYMGKKRIIAETGAGQHGVATATVAALMDMECIVYMGSVDVERQAPNVKRMKLLGAQVVPVESGSKTLKDAGNAAFKDWVTNCQTTHYIIGSVIGPHPFPMMVRDFQRVIGDEALQQCKEKIGALPEFAIACVGGGSNAAGLFSAFVHTETKLIGVEAGGISEKPGDHCATLTQGQPGIFQGSLTYLLQDEECQAIPVHSISAGLDYPSVGPEHSYWKDAELVEYQTCSDEEALTACLQLSRTEGIIPALESSHALGYMLENEERFQNRNVLVNLSGRGDKDMEIILREASL
jgi:tryptophan synthase beta chain